MRKYVQPKLRKFKSSRTDTAALRYFKGTVSQAKKVSLKEIVSLFVQGGIYFQTERQAWAFAKQVRTQVLKKAVELRQPQSLKKQETMLIQVPAEPMKTSEGEVLVISVNVTISPSNRILIHQGPVMHGVTFGPESSFENLKKLLKTKFKGRSSPNVEFPRSRRSSSHWASPNLGNTLTEGDLFTLQIMKPVKPNSVLEGGWLESSDSSDILAINIVLNPKSSAKEIQAKKEFYKKELGNFGIPFRFVKPGTS